MYSEAKKYFVSAFFVFILFCLFSFLITKIDVKAVGPMDSSVGFSAVNYAFSNFLPYNNLFFELSEILGYVALIMLGFFCVKGLVQLLSSKSFKKIDGKILFMGVVVLITGFFYFAFDKLIIVNFRPVLVEGKLEVSYPSSHTLLGIVMFMCSSIYFREEHKCNLRIVFFVFAVATVVFRMVSGVHWFTDIIGGVLLSCSIVIFYNALVLCLGEKKGNI